MRRWRSYIEITGFPLKVIFLATIMLGLGSMILNPNFVTLVGSQDLVSLSAEVMRTIASSIILMFPLIFLMRTVDRRDDDPMITVAALIAYFTLHIVTMFINTDVLVSVIFRAPMGPVDLASLGSSSVSIVNPLYTGLIGTMIVFYTTRFAYRITRGRSAYSLWNFVDRQTSLIIWSIVFAILGGIVVSFTWPYLVQVMISIYNFIAHDLNNPINLSIYGILDRITETLGLQLWTRKLFWFGELGGSWSDAFGIYHLGDVGMWTGQIKSSLFNLGSGKLITPYYILNIFCMPAYLISIYQTYTDKMEKRKIRGFIFVAVAASIMFGTLLPIELFLLFSAPLLYVFHLGFTGALYALFAALKVQIGYAYTGSVIGATPGSIFDLLIYLRNPALQKSLLVILLVGLVSGLCYLAVSTYYYRKVAVNFITVNEKDSMVEELLDCLGGLENLKLINSSVFNLTVQVHNRDVVDFHKIKHHYITRIVESKAGYSLTYGACSHILWMDIQHRLKELSYQQSA
jgi:maltose/glucose PTS system EIICB component